MYIVCVCVQPRGTANSGRAHTKLQTNWSDVMRRACSFTLLPNAAANVLIITAPTALLHQQAKKKHKKINK